MCLSSHLSKQLLVLDFGLFSDLVSNLAAYVSLELRFSVLSYRPIITECPALLLRVVFLKEVSFHGAAEFVGRRSSP